MISRGSQSRKGLQCFLCPGWGTESWHSPAGRLPGLRVPRSRDEWQCQPRLPRRCRGSFEWIPIKGTAHMPETISLPRKRAAGTGQLSPGTERGQIDPRGPGTAFPEETGRAGQGPTGCPLPRLAQLAQVAQVAQVAHGAHSSPSQAHQPLNVVLINKARERKNRAGILVSHTAGGLSCTGR